MAKNTKTMKTPYQEMLQTETQIKSYVAFIYKEFNMNHILKLSNEISRLSIKYNNLKNITLTEYLSQNQTNVSAKLPSFINSKFKLEI